MNEDNLTIVRESFGRCALQKTFFEDFYDTFMGSAPEIPQFFTKTDMNKQRQLLREGISFMILYADKQESGNVMIERLGVLHDASHVNVRPDLYRFWVQSLLKNIEKHDRRFNEQVRRAWEDILKAGIQRFVEVYDKRTEVQPG